MMSREQRLIAKEHIAMHTNLILDFMLQYFSTSDKPFKVVFELKFLL